MSDADLPVPVSSPASGSAGAGALAVPGDGVGGAHPGGGEAGGDAGHRRGRQRLRLLAGAGATVLGILLALAGASLLGDGFRNAVLVETDVAPPAGPPAYSDRPDEAARFFDRRDSVTVRVPRDMTAGEFLTLYHLENNPSARRALADQLGAADDQDPLREGETVILRLTLPREGGR